MLPAVIFTLSAVARGQPVAIDPVPMDPLAILQPPVGPRCNVGALFCSPTGDIHLCQPRNIPILEHSCGGQGCSSCPLGLCNKNNQSACGLVPRGVGGFFQPCSTRGLYCAGNAIRYCTTARRGRLVEWCGAAGCNGAAPFRCNPGPAAPSMLAPSMLAPSMLAPSMPAPSMPAPSMPAPSMPAPSAPAPSAPSAPPSSAPPTAPTPVLVA